MEKYGKPHGLPIDSIVSWAMIYTSSNFHIISYHIYATCRLYIVSCTKKTQSPRYEEFKYNSNISAGNLKGWTSWTHIQRDQTTLRKRTRLICPKIGCAQIQRLTTIFHPRMTVFVLVNKSWSMEGSEIHHGFQYYSLLMIDLEENWGYPWLSWLRKPPNLIAFGHRISPM